LFLTVGVGGVIAALTTMAVKIINALKEVGDSVDRSTAATNGIVHELMNSRDESAHAKGVLQGMEEAKIIVPVAIPEVVLKPKEQTQETEGQ
jgi:hypothetical protein